VLTALALAGGLALLVLGGDLLVRGSSALAALLGLSPLVIGLTVVAFGTSAPELAVSLQSVRAGAASLALGNVVGSNIFNVLLILGLSALILPLPVSRRVVWIEVPVMIAVSGLVWAMAADGRVAAADGLLLVAVLATYTWWLIRTSSHDTPDADGAPAGAPRAGPLRAGLMTLGGLGLLVLGADWFVAGAVALASAFGVSDVVIGLTIVAGGTSLPEVAASVMAALKGQRDIAIGNVLGSNVFNLTLILGLSSLTAGGLGVPPGIVTFDLVVMMAAAVACLPIFFTGHRIARWEGALFLAYYVAYVIYLVLDATEHDQLPHFTDAMALFALPLTAVTLTVLAARSGWRRMKRG
jgi:cation:H+ antiporter